MGVDAKVDVLDLVVDWDVVVDVFVDWAVVFAVNINSLLIQFW